MVHPHQVVKPDHIYVADAICFWLSVLGGTLCAASLFGFINGLVTGAVIGPAIALVCGLPVCISTMVASWPIWRSRYYLVSAATSGGITGLLAELWLSGTVDIAGVAAILMGSIGACASADMFTRHTDLGGRFDRSTRNHSARYSLQLLFQYITAVAVIITIWTWIFKIVSGINHGRIF